MSALINGITSLAASLSSDFSGLTATSVSDETSTQAAATTTSSDTSASTTKSSLTVSTKSSRSSVTSTLTSSSSTTSTTSSTTSTSLKTSSSPTPTSTTPANPVSQPTNTASPSSDGNNISVAGIAVAATFGFLIIIGVLFLLWKYLPAARRYRERQYEARSHRKGLSFDSSDTEEAMHLDDPKQGLGLRKFSFHTSPTYYPGMPQESTQPAQQPQQTLPWDEQQRTIAKKPLISQDHSQSQLHMQNDDEYAVSPISVRSMTGGSGGSGGSGGRRNPYPYPPASQYQDPTPSSYQPNPTTQPTKYRPYRDTRSVSPPDVRDSQIGVAVPIATPRIGQQSQWQGPVQEHGRSQSRDGEKGLPPLPMN